MHLHSVFLASVVVTSTVFGATYDPRTNLTGKYASALAASISASSGWVSTVEVPVVGNGTSLNNTTDVSNGSGMNRMTAPDIWAGQVPATQLELQSRNKLSARVMATENQAISFLFSGTHLVVSAYYQASTAPDRMRVSQPVMYTVFLDGQIAAWDIYDGTIPRTTVPTPQPLQLAVGPLARGWHNVTVVMPTAAGGQMVVNGASWQTPFMYKGPEISADTERRAGDRLPFTRQGSAELRYTRSGAVEGTQLSFSHDVSKPLLVLKRDSTVSTILPSNSSWVEVDGMVGPGYGVATLVLDPPPPDSPSSLSLSTNSSWLAMDTFLAVPLDPSVRYNLTISTSDASAGAGVYLDSTVVVPYDTSLPSEWREDDTTGTNTAGPSEPGADAASSGSKTGPAVIAGGVVGGVLGAALIATALWLCFRKRYIVRRIDGPGGPNWRSSNDSMTSFQVDEEGQGMIQPFSDGRPSRDGRNSETGSKAMAAAGLSLPTMPDRSHANFARLRSHTPPQRGKSPMQSGSSTTSESSLVRLTKLGQFAGDGSGDGGPSRGRGPRQIEFVQEDDAGDIEVERQLVPPRYNPAWEERWTGSKAEDAGSRAEDAGPSAEDAGPSAEEIGMAM